MKIVWPFLVLGQTALLAQTLHVSSAVMPPGGRATVEVSLDSPHGSEPSTMQWNLTLPAAAFPPADQQIRAGPAAQAAGKLVSCAVKTKTEATYTFICMAYGGVEPIPKGVVALVQLACSPDVGPGPYPIHIRNALAVTRDLKRTLLKDVDAVVTIRKGTQKAKRPR